MKTYTHDAEGNFLECVELWRHDLSTLVNIGLDGLTSLSTPKYYEQEIGQGTLLLLTPSNIFAFIRTNGSALATFQSTAYALDAAKARMVRVYFYSPKDNFMTIPTLWEPA